MVTAAVFLSKFSVLYFVVKPRAYFYTNIQRLCAFRGALFVGIQWNIYVPALFCSKGGWCYQPLVQQNHYPVDKCEQINYTIPALGSRGWYGSRVWPTQTSNLGPFASIYHTLPMSSWALKTDTRKRVLGSYLYQPLPHHGPWIVIWSLNNWGELKIMCILFN